jgi:hypothetical protein
MLVMFDVTDPVRMHTMTKGEDKAVVVIGVGPGGARGRDDRGNRRREGERSETRLSYRGGYYSRSLIARVGMLDLRVPQDRMGRLSTDPGLDPGVTNARRRRWWAPWPRCTCKGFRPARACPREGGGEKQT